MQNFAAHAQTHVVAPLFPGQLADSQMSARGVQVRVAQIKYAKQNHPAGKLRRTQSLLSGQREIRDVFRKTRAQVRPPQVFCMRHQIAGAQVAVENFARGALQLMTDVKCKRGLHLFLPRFIPCVITTCLRRPVRPINPGDFAADFHRRCQSGRGFLVGRGKYHSAGNLTLATSIEIPQG